MQPVIFAQMNKTLPIASVLIVLFISFTSCRKDGMHSAEAKKIQYRWERISSGSSTDYLDGRPVTWTVRRSLPGIYLEFKSDGYFYDNYNPGSTKYQYKVDGDRILYLYAGSSRATTPQYTDTSFIKHVDDHLLVLYSRKYFLSPAYNYMNEYIDSLKR